MRAIDTATATALAKAPDSGLVARDLVWFRGRSLADPAVRPQFAFWNDLDTVSILVEDPKTGGTVGRDYIGDGALISVPDIPLTSDLSIRTIRISLSQIHPAVQAMVRGADIRFAEVQVHRAVFDPASRLLVSAKCHFLGKVDRAPLGTPSVSEEGGIDLECVSDTRELTRTNPAKKSDEWLKARSGDRFYRYTGTANVPVFWGVEKSRKKD
ncbi:hypothetical protein [Aurantimonas sp. 22II-16-19i]|uniref:hypothetical protein n=1 Tax=Aurantimonas sp. 22II-16-19i TaxID=1317114 RepID=UPI0009F7AF80|nr:hypothetical protein [Aurantimonas sp. 22II-16-19i]ORE89739.1 hypothetical protein ATO4_23712 [Aurantimonas sp. 22II-16-19i]